MKYKPEYYEDSGLYGDDDEVENKKAKLVRCRKVHKCVICEKQIGVGDTALRETGFLDGEPVSCYTCIPCIEEWLDDLLDGYEYALSEPQKGEGE